MFLLFFIAAFLIGNIASESNNAVALLDNEIASEITQSPYAAQSCPSGQQWECTGVSTDYNYVACVNNMCVCSSRGFAGNATVSNKCRCDTPNKVYWEMASNQNVPFCLNYSNAIDCQHGLEKEERLKNKIYLLYQYDIDPNPAIIIQAFLANMTHPNHPVFDLFSHDSKGRVDPVGQYAGRDGDIEYFFGAVWTRVTRIWKVRYNYLFASGNMVYSNVDLYFARYNPQNMSQLTKNYTLNQHGTHKFNEAEEILSQNLVITNLGAAVNSTGGIAFGTLAYAQQTCFQILSPPPLGAGCTQAMDPDGYYVDMADCINHFVNIYPPGSMDNLWFNGYSVACRYYHLILAYIVPQMHCPHVGKTGGGKCINHDYESYFNESF